MNYERARVPDITRESPGVARGLRTITALRARRNRASISYVNVGYAWDCRWVAAWGIGGSRITGISKISKFQNFYLEIFENFENSDEKKLCDFLPSTALVADG